MSIATPTRVSRLSVRPAEAAKRCDLCEGARFDLVGQLDRHGEVLHTGICLGCGLVCHMNIPSERELAEFYASDYRREYHGETTPSPRRVMRAWKNALRIYRQLAPRIQPTDSVLEVGAGIGCNVKVFERHGHDARGLEPNAGFQRYSAEQLKARVERGELFTWNQDRRFDLVLLVHVIEHFRSPRQALLRIGELLRPGGRLYVECPNLTAPFARPGKMFHFAHIHNFTPGTLRKLAQCCGFDVEHVFSTADDPNLQMLLRRPDGAATRVYTSDQGEGAREVLAAMNRYSGLTYHLRTRYLADRLTKLNSYVGERLIARPYVRRLIENCQRDTSR